MQKALFNLNQKNQDAYWECLYKRARPITVELVKNIGGKESEGVQIFHTVIAKLRELELQKDLNTVVASGLFQWIKFTSENEMFEHHSRLSGTAAKYLEKKIKPWIARLPYVNGQDDVNEIFQRAIADFLSNKEKPRHSDMVAYIIGICKNKGRDLSRKQTLERNRKEKFVKEQGDTLKVEQPQSFEYAQLPLEMEKQLRKMFAQIGDKCKELLRLFHKEKIKGKEIARIRNYKDANVARKEVYNCRKKLRSLLIKHPILINHLNLLWDKGRQND
ncbi:MAG: hypothetical protein AAFZ15_33980 [Bacteroidota bacterium]